MAYPIEPEFAYVKMGNGASPEVFTLICGIDNISLNQTANTSDRFRRDCAKPGQVPTRKVKTNGKQWDVTGSGVPNSAEFARINAAIGIRKNYKIDFGRADGTDAGVLLGTYTGPGVLTSFNTGIGDDGTAEINIAGEDEIVWAPAT